MDVSVLAVPDILILTVPFLAILLMGMFGLDTDVANPERRSSARRFFCEVDGKGQSSLCDPDGRLWCPAGTRQIDDKLGAPGVWERTRMPAADHMLRRRTPFNRFYIIEEE
jgi:hypothetical protein